MTPCAILVSYCRPIPRLDPSPGETDLPRPTLGVLPSLSQILLPCPDPRRVPPALHTRCLAFLGHREARGGVSDPILEAMTEASMSVADITSVIEPECMQLSQELVERYPTQQREIVRAARAREV